MLSPKFQLGAVLLLLAAAAGCRQDMHDQPKYIPLRPSEFFGDGRSSRPPVEGTIARGQLNDDESLYSGRDPAGKFVNEFPFPVTRAVLDRGQNRYNVYCAPCHDRLGDGDGRIVRRGYRHPPSYHIDRLRQVPNGYIYDVITSGFGAMPDYSSQIHPSDRWAIVAYVRALQLAHNGKAGDVPADKQAELNQEGGQ